jgi:hypothetical protein
LATSIMLVENNEPVSAIILPDNGPAHLQALAENFVETVARSTGASIPIVTENNEPALPAETTRVFLGPCRETLAAGLDAGALEAEAYRILGHDGRLFILGNDAFVAGSNALSQHSVPTRWALNHLLETGLGVRWLWPGGLGTYIPRSDSLSFQEMDRTYQPKLLIRSLRAGAVLPDQDGGKTQNEVWAWLANHQTGRRGDIRFGHAFGDWWEKYGKDHPDYFAEPPPGVQQPYPQADRVKLRLSNPAVIEQIAREYEAAGAPEYWNVCPNDGGGFDLSAETRAWDIPADQDPEKIWKATANLTARYVKFWNLLHERLKRVNPHVKLASYAYSAYRYPPPAERPLAANMVLGIVDSYVAYDQWKAWSGAGAGMFLRPNWWHVGAEAPHLPLRETADFMHFAWENGMFALDQDSILGCWATQGMNYYFMARNMTRPDLTLEEIIGEYTSAFGAGAPKIREYIAYWENETRRNGYPAPVGGAGSTNPDGRYEQLVREGKFQMNPIGGSHEALPWLYPDEVLLAAEGLLDEADTLIGDSDPEAGQRVEFLRQGLQSLRATRDVVALSQKVRRAPGDQELLQQFRQASDELEAFRVTLTPRHILWGERMTLYEDRYRFPIRPRNMNLPAMNMDGL